VLLKFTKNVHNFKVRQGNEKASICITVVETNKNNNKCCNVVTLEPLNYASDNVFTVTGWADSSVHTENNSKYYIFFISGARNFVNIT